MAKEIDIRGVMGSESKKSPARGLDLDERILFTSPFFAEGIHILESLLPSLWHSAEDHRLVSNNETQIHNKSGGVRKSLSLFSSGFFGFSMRCLSVSVLMPVIELDEIICCEASPKSFFEKLRRAKHGQRKIKLRPSGYPQPVYYPLFFSVKI